MGTYLTPPFLSRRMRALIGAVLAIGLLFSMLYLLAVSGTAVLAQDDSTGGDDGSGDAEGADNIVADDADAPTDTDDVAGEEGFVLYLPIAGTLPPTPELTASRPTSTNAWTMSWESEEASLITGYVLEESQMSNFASGVVSYTLGTETSQAITKPATPNNTYYYRVHAIVDGQRGDWSNIVQVNGAYLDNFDNSSTGWAPRRMTYLEETDVYYGSGTEAGYLIAIVADRWDWVLGSPLRQAPQVPYAIEYRSRVHDGSNLVSGGAVMGGDWNFDACPEIGNVYQTDNCFNQFYNFNFIFFGPLKLLFEQVDTLNYCPNCGGSQIKRLGPTQVVDGILPNPATSWHTYRMEMRADGIHFYLDNNFVRKFTDTTYINDPYFGVFASTDEYKPSIWFYDYYKVTPID